jgi:hypothetical protein
MNHIVIYREPGRYAGWPANYGIWSWGNEIVVGFTVGYHDSSGGFHARDRTKPFVGMQARSLDGGETWDVRRTPCRTPDDKGLSADEHVNEGLRLEQSLAGESAPSSCDGVDFTHPDFALMCARTGLKAGARSFFYTSADRCQTWDGPFALPLFGQTGVAARTDYLVSSRDECILFLTASKSNGNEGRVFCARTTDGGETFEFLSPIGPEPEGFSIMPASVRLSASRILVAVRCREARREFQTAENWIDLYASDDNGVTWTFANRPVNRTGSGGNPPTLTRLLDGRLCLTYGYRDAPYRICAKLSDDDGATWGDEIVLRDNGGGHDIGYPRTMQRPDGTMVTAYYFHDEPDSERYIAATLWKP